MIRDLLATSLARTVCCAASRESSRFRRVAAAMIAVMAYELGS
jgi:hypothetical protein